MLVERFDLARLQPDSRVAVLNTLQIGDSLFFAEHKEAQSMRVLSYYFLKTRNLGWRFTFRKIDNGWRLIRIRQMWQKSQTSDSNRHKFGIDVSLNQRAYLINTQKIFICTRVINKVVIHFLSIFTLQILLFLILGTRAKNCVIVTNI